MRDRPPSYVLRHSPAGIYQHNTSAESLFAAAYNALCWFRDSYAPKPPPDAVLEVQHGWTNAKTTYHVCVSRVLEHYGREHAEFFSMRECPRCHREISAREIKRHLLDVHGLAS